MFLGLLETEAAAAAFSAASEAAAEPVGELLTEWLAPACKLSRRSASTASAAPINSCKGISIWPPLLVLRFVAVLLLLSGLELLLT